MGDSQVSRFLKRFKAKIQRGLEKFRYIKTRKVVSQISQFPDFPSSACTDAQYIELTMLGCLNTHHLLRQATGRAASRAPREDSEFETTEESKQLKLLFDKFGSDKSNKHNYHEFYGLLLSKSGGKINKVLEIGLGTNNPDVPSNMGISGKPGASLRAWREFNPDCYVFGADIDSRILFHEERIETFQLDQLSDASWEKFVHALKQNRFDLIIDDGLHSPMANLKSIKYLLPLLSTGGVLIIEDIAERSLPIWDSFVDMAPEHWQIEILKMRKAFVVSIKPQ
jgi:hypothetical protein